MFRRVFFCKTLYNFLISRLRAKKNFQRFDEKFWQACQTCLMRFQINVLSRKTFLGSINLLNHFLALSETFRTFIGKTSAALSKLFFTCPADRLEEILADKNILFLRFQTSSEKLSDFWRLISSALSRLHLITSENIFDPCFPIKEMFFSSFLDFICKKSNFCCKIFAKSVINATWRAKEIFWGKLVI